MMKEKTLLEENPSPAQRRGFLTTLLAGVSTGFMGIAVVPLLTAIGRGAPPPRNGGRGGGGGRGGQGGGRGGNGQAGNGQAGNGQAGNGQGPAQLAAMLIQRFDQDGDRALNQRELAMALMAMQQRMNAAGGQGAGGQRAGGQGFGPQGPGPQGQGGLQGRRGPQGAGGRGRR